MSFSTYLACNVHLGVSTEVVLEQGLGEGHVRCHKRLRLRQLGYPKSVLFHNLRTAGTYETPRFDTTDMVLPSYRRGPQAPHLGVRLLAPLLWHDVYLRRLFYEVPYPRRLNHQASSPNSYRLDVLSGSRL